MKKYQFQNEIRPTTFFFGTSDVMAWYSARHVSDTLGYNVATFPKSSLVNILLFGKEGIPDSKNLQILNFVIEYIIKSKRLDILGGEGGTS